MRSDKKLYEIALQILQEMYAVSDPPLDFLEFKGKVDSGEVKCEPEWYMKHQISKADHDRIIKESKKKYKLTQREEKKMTMTFLNWGPTFKGIVND